MCENISSGVHKLQPIDQIQLRLASDLCKLRIFFHFLGVIKTGEDYVIGLHVAHKVFNICNIFSLAFYRKCLLTPGLEFSQLSLFYRNSIINFKRLHREVLWPNLQMTLDLNFRSTFVLHKLSFSIRTSCILFL